MWHLSQFSKRLELLIRPSNFGYNAYNQPILVKIPNQIISYLDESYNIGFVDIEGNILLFSSKKFSPGTNEVEYYVKIESIDDINYTSLFVYYNNIYDYIILFEDDFESGSLSTNGWTSSNYSYGNVSTHTANSGVYSIYTTHTVSITSKVIPLNCGVAVFCWIRRGSDSFSEDPDTNENLIIEYLNSSSSWVQLDIFYGNGTPGQIYNKQYNLPSNALHAGFRLRFRQTGGGSGYDYWHIDDVIISTMVIYDLGCIFDGAYIVNYLSEVSLVSIIGPNFSNHSAALHQPICNTYAAKITGGTTYISCSISKSSFTLFFNCYLISGSGYLVYFSFDNYVYVSLDGSLVAKINGTEYNVGSKLYFNICSTFSITNDGNNIYIVINGLTKLVIKQIFSISEIRIGGNGSSGYSVECYFFDLFLLPPKLPLYSYYLHNTTYDNSNFFRDSGYDNIITNGYLTGWPEVIFSGDEVIFKSNISLFDGWDYYRPINITNSGTVPLSYQQVVVELSTSELGNPYNNINSDGSDIRFVSSSGVVLPYCVDIWDNTGYSEIRVTVTGMIPIGDSAIYMYYGKESAVSTASSIDYCGYYDYFNIKNDSYWVFDGYQTVPHDLSGENVLKMYGDGTWRHYYSLQHIVTGMEARVEFLRTGISFWHIAALENSDSYNRWCIQEDNLGNIRVQYRVNDGSWVFPKTLIAGAKTGIWYVALLKVDDINGFYIKVWEKDNPAIWNDYTYAMPTGLSWRFHSWKHESITDYHDNYKVYNTIQGEPFITTSGGGEIVLDGVWAYIGSEGTTIYTVASDETMYSVSFNNGSSWYVSDLNYNDIFTKYFGSPSEFSTVLRLTGSSGTIDKDYIIKVNDFNQFNINYLVDFTAESTEDGYDDTEIDFITRLPTLYGTECTLVEYPHGWVTVNSGFINRPVEYLWGGTLGSGVISKDVEYCFDTIVDSWVDDTEVDFWLGKLYQGYYKNYYIYFTLNSSWVSYVNFDVDFVLANWKYFPTQTSVICSVVSYNDQETETKVGKGSLMRFLSDIKASDMIYDDFNSSIFCSLSGIFPDCFSEIRVISGSIGNYESNVSCSLLDTNSFGAEIKLNTVIIEKFNIEETVIAGTNFCFNVDVYDTYYGVTTSGIQIYMNTNTITGNKIVNKTFSTIPNGHTVSWCYDVGVLSPSEYIEIIIKGTNKYGDLNIASYFLRYGKRYYYNLYHITKHDYEILIPMLMVAENNVNIFPSFSTESMYVRIESYKRKNLGASIFGVSLDRGDIQAEIVALTNNFYNGGHYKVRVECNDLSGNVMNPLEFEFTIRSDGL